VIMKQRRRTITSTRSVSTRPIARRTCVACRQIKPKRELIRLVRTSGGDIETDITGKKEGRGAYLCPSRECWEKALAGKQLEQTLRVSITRENREQLIKDGEAILKGVD
jgi:predicted RNA-binding protein YlxR (DUF448 family)